MDKSMERFIFFFLGEEQRYWGDQGSQIRIEFGKLHFSSLLLLGILSLSALPGSIHW